MFFRLPNSKAAPEAAAKISPPQVKTVDPCAKKPAAAPANEDTSVGKLVQVNPALPTVSVKSPQKTVPTVAGKITSHLCVTLMLCLGS